MNLPQRLTPLLITIAALTLIASAAPFIFHHATGPEHHVSVRQEEVRLYAKGLYRHMPADVAVQGLAQDLVTFFVAVPFLLSCLLVARRDSGAGYLALTGAVGYLFVQYFLYLAMAMYNELFLLWVALVLLTSQALVRLLVYAPKRFTKAATLARSRRYVGGFLILNGCLIALLWLSIVVPPLLDGSLYPQGLAHFTTMIVQAFDLALFLPPSIAAGYWYLQERRPGGLLAPVYVVFLALQMTALLAKVLWMTAVGAQAGPALVLIPVLLVGAIGASILALRPLVAGAGLQPAPRKSGRA